MNDQSFRKFTDYERAVLDRILELDFRGKEEIKDQFSQATASLIEGTDDNYGSIKIKTLSNKKADVMKRVPVMGVTRDEGGGPVEILLHTADGIVVSLEFVRMDGAPMVGLPQLDIMQFHVRGATEDQQAIKVPE
jgi:hypothetical protein